MIGYCCNIFNLNSQTTTGTQEIFLPSFHTHFDGDSLENLQEILPRIISEILASVTRKLIMVNGFETNDIMYTVVTTSRTKRIKSPSI